MTSVILYLDKVRHLHRIGVCIRLSNHQTSPDWFRKFFDLRCRHPKMFRSILFLFAFYLFPDDIVDSRLDLFY
jgi:hypothetical protein